MKSHARYLYTLVIGSDEACGLRLPDPYVSPRHAAIRRRDDNTYWIEDLGSTNGTHLQREDMRLRVWGPRRLYTGDVICIGRTRIPWDVADG